VSETVELQRRTIALLEVAAETEADALIRDRYAHEDGYNLLSDWERREYRAYVAQRLFDCAAAGLKTGCTEGFAIDDPFEWRRATGRLPRRVA
jgi:hypothetical protein